jgi:hypothetical protein
VPTLEGRASQDGGADEQGRGHSHKDGVQDAGSVAKVAWHGEEPSSFLLPSLSLCVRASVSVRCWCFLVCGGE